jgi:hypothetical protein
VRRLPSRVDSTSWFTMRFHSTPESVEKGEITQLAIIECFLSVAIYIGIGIYLRTFRHLAVAVAVAPLTLLRTEVSARWGVRKYEESQVLWGKLFSKIPVGYAVLGLPFWSAVIAAAGVVIRVVAALYWTLRKPLDALRDMPQNWLRQSFCTDLFYPPEVVPLETVYGRPGNAFSFRGLLTWFREEARPVSILLTVLLSPFLVIGFLPPLFYRISFKATFLAYLPFVWVAHATLQAPESVKLRLERITKGELERTRRWVSGLVATALAAKFALAHGWIDVTAALARFPSKKFVEGMLVPNFWRWWQITLGIDALMTFCLLYYADAALARVDSKDAWREETVTKTISTASFLRASLGVVTMSHFFFVALSTVAAGHVRL